MEEIRWASGVTQARMLKEGVVSSEELRQMTIGTIERLNPVLNAVVVPLYDRPGSGVPMLIKDAGQELAGTPHWVGVAALRDAQSTSSATTALAKQFESAGFAILAKGACPQLSNGVTTEPSGFEPTRNPWDVTRSVGGSSGGPAAAVAAGMVAVAHGSDATGSLRCPAALCGVATLNPTSGRIRGVPPAGQPPSSVWRDFVLARHAEDLTAVFSSLTGAVRSTSTERLRIGLLDHDPEFGMALHPACAEGVHIAAGHLESLGHDVEIAWPEALNHLWAPLTSNLGIIIDAARTPAIRWVSERLGRPVERGELDIEVFEAADRDAARGRDEVEAAQQAIEGAVSPITTWWDEHDVLVTPATFQPAWPLGGNPGPREMGTFLPPFSFSGQPALSLPLHETEDGLPVGVQLVGRRGSDEVLLRLAEELQTVFDWSVRRPRMT